MSPTPLLDWTPSVRELNRVPAQNHSSTSIAAAEKIYPHQLSLKEKVLQYLRGYPNGLTDSEMQIGLGMSGDTQRPRRVKLVEEGRVRELRDEHGEIVTRQTKKMRAATVWIAS